MKNICLRRLLQPAFSPEQKEIGARIRKAVDAWVCQKGYLKPLNNVEEIAQDIGIPPDQLSIFIRFHYDNTLLGWRKDLRIEDAKRLLLEYPELPLSTIGELVGIRDKSNFRKQFTETVKMSPQQWREKNGR